jgi:serine/threonine protein kinase
VERLAAYGEPVEGTPFGRYRLIELLGRGGMGEVWRAHDTGTDRVVAIKVLPAHLSEDKDFQQRFRREAHAAARLDTPHVVPIYDYGEIDGRLFVSMRLIEGRDLDAVLADGPLEPARAVRIIEQVAEALNAAHEVGLIHRDIKPSNILLGRNDFAYLIDFGIARAADETRMTKSGNTIGTFAYIAPERLDSTAEEDARADIYSLACVLYQAITGQPPFAGSTTAHLMYAHVNTPPPRPSTTQPDVPARFDAVIAKGMAKDPDQRYATTVELANAAHDAITVPIARPTPSSPTLAATEEAHNVATAEPMTVNAASPAPAKPAPPLQPEPQALNRAGGISRSTTIALILGAIALVAVIAAAIPILTLFVGHKSTGGEVASPTSTVPPSTTKSRSPTSVNKSDVASQITLKMTDAAGNKPDSVNCPSDLPAVVGAQLNCEMKVKNMTFNVNVTVTSVNGSHVKFDMVETVNKNQVASVISDKLAQKVGRPPDSVTCPDNLNGTVGAMLRCQLTDGNQKYGISVTVTSVDAGDVNFDYKVDDQPS